MFTAQVCFLAVFYLFQDKWGYIQKQGVVVVSADDPNSCAAAEDVLRMNEEACRKSNALGTYFSRTNVLNKLFQQA